MRTRRCEETLARATFNLTIEGSTTDVRTLEIVGWSADGKPVADAIVDVDFATGDVLALDGAGVALGNVRATLLTSDGGEFVVPVQLLDAAATSAAMVTVTDLTGDSALVGGDAWDQALALGALSTTGRGVIGGYTFDDAHGIDSSRQVWEGTFNIDQAYNGVAFEFSAPADRCLPEGVEPPADGAVTWEEQLVLQGTAKKPRWKTVSLGIKEAGTEVWAWPFVARVRDPNPEGVYVSLTPVDGGPAARAESAWVRVPTIERLWTTVDLGRTGNTVAEEVIEVSVTRVGAKGDPATVTVVRWDGRIRFQNGGGAALPGPEVVATWADATSVPSVVSVSGIDGGDWDGTLRVNLRGPDVWEDLDMKVTVLAGKEAFTTPAISAPLTELTSTFEGTFVFDASPDGATYRWKCVGCGDDFSPFEVQARFGSGTRISAGQANSKAELL